MQITEHSAGDIERLKQLIDRETAPSGGIAFGSRCRRCKASRSLGSRR